MDNQVFTQWNNFDEFPRIIGNGLKYKIEIKPGIYAWNPLFNGWTFQTLWGAKRVLKKRKKEIENKNRPWTVVAL